MGHHFKQAGKLLVGTDEDFVVLILLNLEKENVVVDGNQIQT